MRDTFELVGAVIYLIVFGFTVYSIVNTHSNYTSGNINEATFWAVQWVGGLIYLYEYQRNHPIRKPK